MPANRQLAGRAVKQKSVSFIFNLKIMFKSISLAVCVYILQFSLFSYFDIYSVSVNLFLVFAVLAYLYFSITVFAYFIFVLAFLFDFLSANNNLLFMIFATLLFLLASGAKKIIRKFNFILAIILMALANLIYFLERWAYFLFNPGNKLFEPNPNILLIEIALNVFVFVIVFGSLRYIIGKESN